MSIVFREAGERDLPGVVALLADDVLGQGREVAEIAPYRDAFARMAEDPNNVLIVGEADGAVVACYQLTIIPGVSLSATTRAQIEGVRVASGMRGQGAGRALVVDAEERARAAGATLLQLTMNRSRKDSHRFYEANGFVPSHIGFKKPL
ncbi:MAG: GNAT family N-acetyltransferase [Silicimonas sp.]|nr:GNAT family N-acetyltransferase [Silicimonas sp.]